MALYDSLNLVRVTAIIDSAGWLGADVIRQKANQALFLVIQHGDAKPEIQAQYHGAFGDATLWRRAQAAAGRELGAFQGLICTVTSIFPRPHQRGTKALNKAQFRGPDQGP